LKYRGIDFEDVEVNAFTKSELKQVSPGYGQVPVVEILDHRGQQEAGIFFKTFMKIFLSLLFW